VRGALAGGLGDPAAFGGRGIGIDGADADVRKARNGLRTGADGDDAGAILADAGQGVKGAGDARRSEPGFELRDTQPVDVEQVEDGEGSLGVVAQELRLVEVVGQVEGVFVGVVVGGGCGRVAVCLSEVECVGVGLGHAQLFGRALAVSAEEAARDANGRAPVGHGVRDCAHGR